jgi:hypothetical protein
LAPSFPSARRCHSLETRRMVGASTLMIASSAGRTAFFHSHHHNKRPSNQIHALSHHKIRELTQARLRPPSVHGFFDGTANVIARRRDYRCPSEGAGRDEPKRSPKNRGADLTTGQAACEEGAAFHDEKRRQSE